MSADWEKRTAADGLVTCAEELDRLRIYAVTLENAAREVISEHKHGFLPARLLNAIDRLDAALAKNPSPSGDKPGISPAGDEAHEIRRDTCGQCDAYPTTPGPQHAQACSEYRTYSKTEGA